MLSLWLFASLVALFPFIYHFAERLDFDRFRPIFDNSDLDPLLFWGAVAFPTLIPFGIIVVAVLLAAFLAFSPLLVLWLILTRATIIALYLVQHQFHRAVEATGLAMMVVGAWVLATH